MCQHVSTASSAQDAQLWPASRLDVGNMQPATELPAAHTPGRPFMHSGWTLLGIVGPQVCREDERWGVVPLLLTCGWQGNRALGQWLVLSMACLRHAVCCDTPHRWTTGTAPQRLTKAPNVADAASRRAEPCTHESAACTSCAGVVHVRAARTPVPLHCPGSPSSHSQCSFRL